MRAFTRLVLRLKFVKLAEEQMDAEALIARAIEGIELLNISNS